MLNTKFLLLGLAAGIALITVVRPAAVRVGLGA
jgi:hypothetical protein